MFKKLFMISCIFTIEGYSAAAEPPPGGGEAALSGQKVYPSLPAFHYRNIFHAAESGDMYAVQEFIRQGANPKGVRVTRTRTTVLHEAALSGNLPLVQYLVDLGADPKAVDVYRRTVLHIAAWSGNLTLVQYLVVLGADPKAVTRNGETLLHWAASSGNITLFQYLVDKGANPTAVDSSGWTVLHSAAKSGNLPLVQYLVFLGADPKAVDFSRDTVLHSAAKDNHWDVSIYLADLGVPVPREYQSQINTHRQRIKQQTSSAVKNSMMRKSLARQGVMNTDVWKHIYSFIGPRGLTMSQLISGGYIKPDEVDGWENMTNQQRDDIKARVQGTLNEQYLMQRLENNRRNNAATNIQSVWQGHQVRMHMREGE